MSAFAITLRGIAAMVTAQFVFLLNDTLNKLVSERLPIGEIIFFRGLFAVALMGAIVVAIGLYRELPLLRSRLLIGRVIGELGGTFFFLAALVHLPIGNTTIIFQGVPLGVTAGAALFMGEAVGWRRWTAIVVGFLGVVLVVRPGLAGFEAYSLLVLVAVVFVSFRELTTRAISPSLSVLTISLATGTSVCVMGALMGLAEDGWLMPTLGEFTQIAGAGVLLSIGYLASVIAMRNGDMSVTAAFRYSAVVFAIASGYFVWGDIPDALTIFGSVVIVGAGLFTLYREHKVARAGRRPLIAAQAAVDPFGEG